jgi:hypothetical protein
VDSLPSRSFCFGRIASVLRSDHRLLEFCTP